MLRTVVAYLTFACVGQKQGFCIESTCFSPWLTSFGKNLIFGGFLFVCFDSESVLVLSLVMDLFRCM